MDKELYGGWKRTRKKSSKEYSDDHIRSMQQGYLIRVSDILQVISPCMATSTEIKGSGRILAATQIVLSHWRQRRLSWSQPTVPLRTTQKWYHANVRLSVTVKREKIKIYAFFGASTNW